MFELKNIDFDIDNKTILHNINLHIKANKITTLLGHNGCGKSTLMKVLCRQQVPSSGHIELDGMPLSSYSHKKLALKIAYLPQHPPMTDGVTIYELVSFGRYPWVGAIGRFSQEDHQIVKDAITKVGLNNMSDRFVASLSGGERQRAWVAMLLAQQSQVILLDEPTSSLDIAHQYELIKLIHQLNQTLNLTVVIVLHDINLASRFSDEIIALHSGKIIIQESPKNIMNKPTLKKIYGLELDLFTPSKSDQPISYIP